MSACGALGLAVGNDACTLGGTCTQLEVGDRLVRADGQMLCFSTDGDVEHLDASGSVVLHRLGTSGASGAHSAGCKVSASGMLSIGSALGASCMSSASSALGSSGVLLKSRS